MHRFVLTSRWRLDTTADRVWQLLTDVETWPRWWRDVRHAQLLSRASTAPVGDVVAIDWASALLYRVHLRVTTTVAEHARVLEGRADGDLHGHGLWLLDPVGPDQVDLTYRWDVVLHRPWMRRLAFLLRPLFEWNHFVVMRAGARGMAAALGCRLGGKHEWAGAMR